jgi:outer membrane murein-binding lipoprotein Lpp
MTEQDLKNLLSVYQQKTHELFTQNIALEAKISTLSSLVEALTSKVNALNSELQKLQSSSKPARKIKNFQEDNFT